jgi:hypothetical protein
VIVAVAIVGMVQVPAHQIVDMIAVRNGLMAATWPMDVSGFMGCAIVLRSAGVRIPGADLQRMFIDVIPMHAVQMPVMQIVDVVPVLNRRMAATRPVYVSVRFVNRMFFAHQLSPSSLPEARLARNTALPRY